MNPDSAEHVKRCPTPPSRMGLPNVAHLPRAPRAAPRRASTPRSSSRVRGRRPPPAARHPHSSHQRAAPRVYHLRKTGGWRRPHSRPSEGSSCAAVAAARAALVPGGEARTTASDREARRGEARGGQSRPQTTVCAAVARPLRPSRGAAEVTGRCEERGLREAAEPTSLRHGKRSVAEACASKEPRPGAVESWSRARRRQAARAHAGCREPPSLAAQERG